MASIEKMMGTYSMYIALKITESRNTQLSSQYVRLAQSRIQHS